MAWEYSIELQWKSFPIAIDRVKEWMASNAGASFEGGVSTNTRKLRIEFTAEPSQSEKDDVTTYWNDLGKESAVDVTAVDDAVTLSAAPNYAVQVGDKITYNGETREVTVVTSQTELTVDSAFSSDPIAQACVVESVESWEYFSVDDLTNSTDQALADAVTTSWDSQSTIQKKLITKQALNLTECLQLVKTDFPPS